MQAAGADAGWHFPCPGGQGPTYEPKMWLLMAEPWCEQLWARLCQRDEQDEEAMRGSAGAARPAQASVQDMTFGLNPHRFGEGARKQEHTVREEYNL